MSEPQALPDLEPGQSPWDDWKRERLVRFAQRCYAALRSADWVVTLSKMQDESSNPAGWAGPFWDPGGAGGEAVALIEAVTHEVGYDVESGSQASENLYRAFYRTNLPLLFADATKPNGEPWFPTRWYCEACRVWYEPPEGELLPDWAQHGERDCPGVFRPMTPEDMIPTAFAGGA